MRTKAHFFKSLDLSTVLEPATNGSLPGSGTKVVATIGPSCQSVDVLVQMLQDGMSAARIDLTWGPIEYHRTSLDNLQEAMKKTRKMCAVMLDTLGREVMIRRPFRIDPDGWPTQVGQEIEVKMGQKLILTTRDIECSLTELPVTYARFTDMAQPGDSVYIGRYLVSGADSASLYLKVERVDNGTDVVCVAQNDALLDGLLTVFHVERSSDSLENMQNDQPLLSDYDKECIATLGQLYEIDFVSLSYTRSSEDVDEARDFLDSVGLRNTKIFAKMESRQSLLNFKGTLSKADGIIISRGNLGLDCLPEKMALIQKTLIQTCNLVGKPVLITRLVDTMAVSPRPTRAEATDVANAVLDGVDGFLLGQETLRGDYPIDSVRTILAIATQAEKMFDHHYHFDHLMDTAQEMDDWEPPGTTPPGPSHHGSADDLPALGANGQADGAANGGAPSFSFNGPAKAKPAPGGGGLKRQASNESFNSLTLAVRAMTRFGPSSRVGLDAMAHADSTQRLWQGNPYISKVEAIASAAVRAADKVQASLIIVYTHTGRTAQLVAKYRPPMPILTLVVPRLVSDTLHWRLEGKHNARQSMLTRGLLPVLAAPSPNGDALMADAVRVASSMGIVKPHDHVVVVQRVHEDNTVKVLSVDECGAAVKRLSFKELQQYQRQATVGARVSDDGATEERS